MSVYDADILLFRQEFGSSEVQPGPDSGYVSHSSGGGYPKLLLQPVILSINNYRILIINYFRVRTL